MKTVNFNLLNEVSRVNLKPKRHLYSTDVIAFTGHAQSKMSADSNKFMIPLRY